MYYGLEKKTKEYGRGRTGECMCVCMRACVCYVHMLYLPLVLFTVDSSIVHKTIVYGQSYTLGPKAVGTDSFIVQWTKDGNAINYKEKSRISKNTDGTLLITKADFVDSGEYEWTAKSDADRFDQRIIVTVEVNAM